MASRRVSTAGAQMTRTSRFGSSIKDKRLRAVGLPVRSCISGIGRRAETGSQKTGNISKQPWSKNGSNLFEACPHMDSVAQENWAKATSKQPKVLPAQVKAKDFFKLHRNSVP